MVRIEGDRPRLAVDTLNGLVVRNHSRDIGRREAADSRLGSSSLFRPRNLRDLGVVRGLDLRWCLVLRSACLQVAQEHEHLSLSQNLWRSRTGTNPTHDPVLGDIRHLP